jgi:hypothetical protein
VPVVNQSGLSAKRMGEVKDIRFYSDRVVLLGETVTVFGGAVAVEIRRRSLAGGPLRIIPRSCITVPELANTGFDSAQVAISIGL